ncbi:hypothetical protein IFR04_004079 [Cadophora malorum]|uniref:Uncharacterized protein n=1 Tax=Cadophora malorum TaxID=108018 RepID=A0A8H7WDD2_9HELO|nr:hypothetical protein IFR04_004079 [Cadophora malorum]
MHGKHKYSFGTGFFDQAAGAKLDSQDILVQFLLNSLQKDTVGVNTQESLSIPPTQPTPSGHMVLVQVPDLAPSGSDFIYTSTDSTSSTKTKNNALHEIAPPIVGTGRRKKKKQSDDQPVSDGAAGIGKTAALIQLIQARAIAGDIVGAYISTNAVVDNILGRTLKSVKSKDLIDLDQKLLLRLWTDQMEIEFKILSSVDTTNAREFLDMYITKVADSMRAPDKTSI